MNEVSINQEAKLSPHFTLGEMTKTSAKGLDNTPPHAAVLNLKNLCVWLEALRDEYNRRYGEDSSLVSGPLEDSSLVSGPSRMVPPPTGTRPHCESLGTRPQQSSPHRSSLPIVINSGYRSEAVNRAIGGVKGSNHLTGCAVDIHVDGIEQALRYAVILLDISEERKEDFDELLIEGKGFESLWLHFAVRPSGNRRKVRFIQT